MKTTAIVCAAVVGGALLTLTLSAALPVQDAATPAGQDPPAGDMEDMGAMMEAWMQASTPGEPHAMLATTAGVWNLDVKHWMDPSMPPQESKATSTFEIAMGGRYLVEHAEGTSMVGPFQGMGLTAFDNVTQQFVNVWVDNMGTGVMIARGGPAVDGVYEMTGEYPNVMTGSPTGFRSRMEYLGDDERFFTMWEDRGGAEAKVMEIRYVRAAGEDAAGSDGGDHAR